MAHQAAAAPALTNGSSPGMMPGGSPTAPVHAERDPIADARALVAMAIGLGTRVRTAHRLGQVTDRKASLYVNTLVRHAARLLQSAATHDVPVLRASNNGPGGNSVHYVLRHDRMDGPPSAIRFVTVGSDARLRCCVVADHDGSRLWADYDVSTAPNDLPLRVILDALSALINRLEQSVTRLEAIQLEKEIQLETDIAAAKARLSGMSDEGDMPRRHAESEEPVRPWTRHVQGTRGQVAAPAAEEAIVAAAAETATAATSEEPTADADTNDGSEPNAPTGHARRPFKLSRLKNAI